MDQTERRADLQLAISQAIEGRLADVWTAMPGIIQSYDAVKNTVQVQVTIKAQVRDAQGNFTYPMINLLSDVPVLLFAAGGFLITLPIVEGDECLVVFASRCIDSWLSEGDIQLQPEYRKHSISDGFAIVGPFSYPRVPASISTTNLEIRNTAGTAKILITPAGDVNIISARDINLTATRNVNITAPSGVEITGKVDATGEGTFNGGHTVSAHVHGGVQSGGSDTLTPTG